MTANMRAGMRRLALVLGILGAAASTAHYSYPRFRDLAHRYDQHKEFTRIMASVAVQNAIIAIKNSPRIYTVRKNLEGALIIRNNLVPDETMLRYGFTNKIAGKTVVFYWKAPGKPTDVELYKIQDRVLSDRIKGHKVDVGDLWAIHFDDEDKNALWFTKRDGQTVSHLTAPTVSELLGAFAFVAIGFLIPWGVVKTITWVGAGFSGLLS